MSEMTQTVTGATQPQSDDASRITARDLRSVFWRSFTLQGSWNYERQQHMGYAFAMSPALKRIYQDPTELGRALQRHLVLFNTTPHLSTFIFGLVERALIPLGLHHIWYPSFWYSFGDYTTQAGQVIHGDQTIWFKMLEEGVKSFSSDTYQNAGKFMQGEFPLMLFALPAACLAMYHEAHTKNKKIAAGILFSAALTCFLTGITEPVEFTFIFVAPILYVFNAIMAGLAYMTMYLLHAHIAKSFSAGFIDYLSFGILPSFNGYQTHFLSAIIIGIPMGLIYYFTFRFVIRRFDVKTPGRTEVTANADEKSDSELATEIITLLGGAHNIDSVGACITRLRLEVAKSDAVDKDGLNGLGARGVVFVGDNGIQVIFGARAQFIAQTMSTMIGK